MKTVAENDETYFDETCDPADEDHDYDFLCDTDTDADETASVFGGGSFNNGAFAVSVSPPTVWKLLKVGETILHVSSAGKVKPYQSIFLAYEGFQVMGTPFRSIPVTDRDGNTAHMYMHELVWRAFHGPPPDGWEVRHKYAYTCVPRRTYSNALCHLTLYPSLHG